MSTSGDGAAIAMARYRVRQPDEEVANRPHISRGRASADLQRSQGQHANILELQRLAGNQAVSDLIVRGDLAVQREDAGTTALAGGTVTDTSNDAEIDGLDLQSDVADAARALKIGRAHV